MAGGWSFISVVSQPQRRTYFRDRSPKADAQRVRRFPQLLAEFRPEPAGGALLGQIPVARRKTPVDLFEQVAVGDDVAGAWSRIRVTGQGLLVVGRARPVPLGAILPAVVVVNPVAGHSHQQPQKVRRIVQ